MTKQKLLLVALEEGFAGMHVLEPDFAPRAHIHARNRNLADDPREIMPEVRSVILLLMPWKPFSEIAEEGRGCEISPYYLSSQKAYMSAKAIAGLLLEEGCCAVSNAQIAIKPLLQKAGIGKTGVNSLISVENMGTRFHVQVILTDAELEPDEKKKADFDVDRMCAGCMRCVKACPSGAIDPEKGVDPEKCLRSKDEGEIAPVEMRPLFGNRLFGCDICQNVCPRNKVCGKQPLPEALKKDLELRSLLNGNLGSLPEKIGRNYARKSRIRMKAALAAGNLKRKDCLDALKALAVSSHDGEREYALWAIEQIEGDET